MAEDRWSINIQGSGARTRGQDTLQTILTTFTTLLTNKGFTVVAAKLSYTGVTIVVGNEPGGG